MSKPKKILIDVGDLQTEFNYLVGVTTASRLFHLVIIQVFDSMLNGVYSQQFELDVNKLPTNITDQDLGIVRRASVALAVGIEHLMDLYQLRDNRGEIPYTCDSLIGSTIQLGHLPY